MSDWESSVAMVSPLRNSSWVDSKYPHCRMDFICCSNCLALISSRLEGLRDCVGRLLLQFLVTIALPSGVIGPVDFSQGRLARAADRSLSSPDCDMGPRNCLLPSRNSPIAEESLYSTPYCCSGELYGQAITDQWAST